MLFGASWDPRIHEIKETLLLEVVPWHLVPAVIQQLNLSLHNFGPQSSLPPEASGYSEKLASII